MTLKHHGNGVSRFRERLGLQQLFLHGEGAEVNREDPNLLGVLDELYAISAYYDHKNV